MEVLPNARIQNKQSDATKIFKITKLNFYEFL